MKTPEYTPYVPQFGQTTPRTTTATPAPSLQFGTKVDELRDKYSKECREAEQVKNESAEQKAKRLQTQAFKSEGDVKINFKDEGSVRVVDFVKDLAFNQKAGISELVGDIPIDAENRRSLWTSLVALVEARVLSSEKLMGFTYFKADYGKISNLLGAAYPGETIQ
ncbi:MAG TPA: hypothetical protein V6C52_02245 [Coleofasciculaceae cyanobacterium]|jgi:hypothetical protein